MELVCGKLNGRRLKQVSGFLQSRSLAVPEAMPDYTVCVYEDSTLAATGSLDGKTLKYIAVDPDYEGEGLCAKVVSALVTYAVSCGMEHLLLCTKPESRTTFRSLGFYPVAATSDMLLMENRRDGIRRYVGQLPRPEGEPAKIAAIVLNGDPFTRGHRYLAEQAVSDCDFLYVFVVSEDKGYCSAADRLRMAEDSLADLPNVCVRPTQGYMVSSATFPAYFLKDQMRARESSAALDLKIFAESFAGPLGITRRYAGEEPFSAVTRNYNEEMLATLPGYGIDMVILPRLLDASGTPVSASRVREMLKQGRYEEARPLVTEATARILEETRT